MRTRGHCPASMTTTRAAAPRTCSQLSSTISSSRSASARTTPATGFGGISFRDSQRLGDGRGNERGIGEGGQLDQPGAVLEAAGGQRAARSASRVLPHPPGPVNVTTRAARRPSRTAASCGPRPTSELISAGSPECRSTPRSVTITPRAGHQV